jgi:hypothetical protein
MRMRRFPRHACRSIALSLASGAVVACGSGGGSSSSFAPPAVTNLGLATFAEDVAGDGDLWVVLVQELSSGNRDLDADGDAGDAVVHVHDLADGTLVNTGLAYQTAGLSRLVSVEGSLAVFAVGEQATGARDLDGDGDADDLVLFAHDHATRTTRNLGLAVDPLVEPAVRDGQAVFAALESSMGDLNGDGDELDSVLHLFDAASGTTENLRLVIGPLLHDVFLEGGQIAFWASEVQDLNGDGDTVDAVLQVHDLASGTIANSELARGFVFESAPLPAAGTWTVLVSESEQGHDDLNGDGDANDHVWHNFEPMTGLVRNLRLAWRPAQVNGQTGAVSRPVSGPATVGLPVLESPGIDLNGDGDFGDVVPVLYDPFSNTLTNPGIAGASRLAFVGQQMAFLGMEFAQGEDLNGDGDQEDGVVFVIDPLTRVATNLGLDALGVLGSDTFLMLPRLEAAAGADWNGDGDTADVVMHLWDPQTGEVTSTGVASVAQFGANETRVLLYSPEEDEGRDLNRDGDRDDLVYVLFDAALRRDASLELAGGVSPSFGNPYGRLLADGKVVLLAFEASQGRDLNGDGDLLDHLFHVAE